MGDLSFSLCDFDFQTTSKSLKINKYKRIISTPTDKEKQAMH